MGVETLNKIAETCEHGNEDLWTREWRLVNIGVETLDNIAETCEHGNGDFWTR